jgi:hypothetical protein
MSASYLRKYGTGTGADIYINIPKAGSANHAVSADWTPAAGDVKISKDGGAAANIGTLPTAVAMGNSTIWKFVFTDAELQAAFVSVTISDSATKAVDDTGFSIETYGNASALHAFDLDTATQSVNVTQFGGSNGTFSGGRPEVNTSHVGGTLQTAGDLKSLIDAVDNFLDTEIAAIITTLGTPAGASISADILVIDNFVDGLESTIGAAGAGLTAIPWNAAWDAEVESECNDALVGQNLDHLVKIAVDTNFATTVHLDSVIGHLADGGTTATFDRTTDALEALRDRGDAAWITNDAASIRSAVGLASANLDTQLSAIDDYIDTEIASLVTSVGAIWTTALTEAYRTDGSTGTGAQLLYEILAHHAEKSISGTTLTTKKLDGLTTAATHTLNSSSAPTSITRAS